MSFSTRSLADLNVIVARGGGLIMDGSTRALLDLVTIANMAAKSGARVTFTGMGARSTADLSAIAELGQGAVVFEG